MGSLHERNVSYWIASAPSTDYPPLATPHTTDVLVVGAGIAGLTTAYLLARDGASVTLIEAGRICSGVTGYTTAKITSQHGLLYAELIERHGEDRARAYGLAQESAIREIARIVSEEGIACDFGRLPAYVYTETAEMVGKIEREGEAARRLGLPATVTDSAELPWDVRAALRFDDQAYFHPRLYCLGLAKALRARGAVVAEGTRALGVERDGESAVVRTDRGEVRARAVVLATHLPFVQTGAFYARTEASRSYVVAARVAELPQAMAISAESPTRSIRPHPGADGNVLILGGNGHPTGREPDTERHYRDLEGWARDRFGLETTEWRWSAQDYSPADGIPYVGRVSGGSPLFVATGFRKWGMTNGTAAAMLITDLIGGRTNAWREAFDASRVQVSKSVGTVLKQGAETVKSLVGDRAKMLTAKDVETLQPGEGAVVKAGGQHVAAFRDDDGTVCAVSATCTHMGCIVHFNNAERTWDCPCHGSRFGLDGRVINGPATKDLEPRSIT